MPIDLPILGVSGDDWITDGVRLAFNREEGQITELALAPPDAFVPAPPDPEIDADLEEGG